MAKQERHLTTELLSAYLDRQLSSEELSLCDSHLKTCKQCQYTLAELRQTVNLLRAMPQPALPRSFVLPLDITATEISQRRSEPANVLRLPSTPTRLSRRPTYLYNTLRAVSSIAAVLAITFLFSGLFTGLPHFGGTSTAGTSTGASVSKAPASSTNTAGQNTPSVVSHIATPAASPAVVEGQHYNGKTTVPSDIGKPLLPLPDISTQLGRFQLGILFLAVSIMAYLLLRWQRRRLQL